jgi:hypothetical protein
MAAAIAASLLTLFSASAVSAQLQPGTVTVTGTGPQYCPSGNGFYPGTGYTVTCYTGLVACNNLPAAIAPIWIDWSVENPGAQHGTIVMFSGGAGTSASAPPGDESTYVPSYLAQGYTVVQTAWASAWEEADDGTGLYGDNIRYAACRPASFLKYIYNNVYSQNGAGAGMCAQGASAGSAAIVYALAWYGADAPPPNGYLLDKVTLSSGPVFSDIEQGCEVIANTQPPTTNICQGSQLGCTGWTATTPFPLQYSGGYEANVELWSGATYNGPSCANLHNQPTTFNTQWLHMSIVDTTSTDGTPSFSYPQTDMAAWLCETDAVDPLDNAAGQGELFYQLLAQAGEIGPHYTIDAVTGCSGDEGVGSGSPQGIFSSFPSGTDAIQYDMGNPQSPAKCQHPAK